MSIEWTDGDLQCCIRKESDTCFVYAEVRYIGPCEYVFCSCDVDILDYTEEQLNEIITAWYEDMEEIVTTYKDNSNQIIAECIFEFAPLCEMTFCSSVYKTEDEAVKALSEYVNRIDVGYNEN